MSDIEFDCPHCNQSLEAPPDMAKELIVCPACSRQIRIPAESARHDFEDITAFEQILEALPDDRTSLEALWNAYEQIGDVAKARGYLFRLGNVIVDEQDADVAQELLEKVRTHATQDESAKDLLGRMEKLIERPKSTAPSTAAEHVRNTFSLDDELAFAWDLLETRQLTQEEYTGVVMDLTEMALMESATNASILHVLENRASKNIEKIKAQLAAECRGDVSPSQARPFPRYHRYAGSDPKERKDHMLNGLKQMGAGDLGFDMLMWRLANASMDGETEDCVAEYLHEVIVRFAVPKYKLDELLRDAIEELHSSPDYLTPEFTNLNRYDIQISQGSKDQVCCTMSSRKSLWNCEECGRELHPPYPGAGKLQKRLLNAVQEYRSIGEVGRAEHVGKRITELGAKIAALGGVELMCDFYLSFTYRPLRQVLDYWWNDVPVWQQNR